MRLREMDGRFAVARLDPADPFPAWARGSFVSVTRTHGELSVVCDAGSMPEHVSADRGWRCLEVEGPMPLDVVGVAAQLTTVLAEAMVNLLIISTHDTDYILVKEEKFANACAALREAGHAVAELPSPPPS
jgi:hypothetical protein